jgi:hypothetical protein
VVNLNPKSFRDVPLAELCLEDALKAGARRSEALKPTDFKETSIRFCIDGLQHWLRTYSEDYCDRSLFYVVRDLIWHWASFCESNATLTEVRKSYVALRRDIVENSSYVDLVDRLQKGNRVKEFGFGAPPFNVLLPMEAYGVISRCGEAIGISFSKFVQVGLAWSLSTNNKGLYTDWINDVFVPLFTEVTTMASKRADTIDEIRGTLEQRMLKKLRG